jgi:hypothetical protein
MSMKMNEIAIAEDNGKIDVKVAPEENKVSKLALKALLARREPHG